MYTYTCRTCPHFVESDEAKSTTHPKERAGFCFGDPPLMVLTMVSSKPNAIQISPQEPMAALVPQPWNPPVLAKRQGCRHHPEAVWEADRDKWARIERSRKVSEN